MKWNESSASFFREFFAELGKEGEQLTGHVSNLNSCFYAYLSDFGFLLFD